MKFQQSLTGRHLSVGVLPTNHLPTVLRLATKVQRALEDVRPGRFVEIPLV